MKAVVSIYAKMKLDEKSSQLLKVHEDAEDKFKALVCRLPGFMDAFDHLSPEEQNVYGKVDDIAELMVDDSQGEED